MGKQSKRPGRRERKRFNSSLSDHKQHGLILRPPFKTLPNLREIPWPKQTLPDMLWLCSVLATNEETVAIPTIARSLNILDRAIASSRNGEAGDNSPVVDGCLSTIELVPEEARASILAELVDRGLYENTFSEGFSHSLGMYPTAPGRWC